MQWRILELNRVDVAYMHAVEETLYRAKLAQNTLVFSRVNPGLSLADNQNYSLDVNEKMCQQDGVKVTRRITGGRSMYLDDNHFILSFISNGSNYLNQGLQYEKTLAIITDALKSVMGKAPYVENSNDIMIEGKKLGGAAQRSSNSANMVHCYIRLNDNLHKMLRYTKLDGVELEKFCDELRPQIACIRDYYKPDDFCAKFKAIVVNSLDHFNSALTYDEIQEVAVKAMAYLNPEFVLGKANFPSKGNCDIIAGSGFEAKLKIKSLEREVKFS